MSAMAALGSDLHERAFAAAASVCDPEIPVLGIADLGVLRDVRVHQILEGANEIMRVIIARAMLGN